MIRNPNIGYALAGSAAGTVAGLFGAGGGMVLVPLLLLFVKPEDDKLFPTSVCIMLPICTAAVYMDAQASGRLPLEAAWPFMLGGTIGGVLSGLLAKKIPTLWLHRGLGALILWGGVRYLC